MGDGGSCALYARPAGHEGYWQRQEGNRQQGAVRTAGCTGIARIDEKGFITIVPIARRT